MFIISNGKKIPAKNLFAISNFINEKKSVQGKKLPSKRKYAWIIDWVQNWFYDLKLLLLLLQCNGWSKVAQLEVNPQLNFYRIREISTFCDFLIRDSFCFVILQASNLWIPCHIMIFFQSLVDMDRLGKITTLSENFKIKFQAILVVIAVSASLWFFSKSYLTWLKLWNMALPLSICALFLEFPSLKYQVWTGYFCLLKPVKFQCEIV